MVLKPEKRELAESIFAKWGLDFSIAGKTTDDLRFRILHHGDEVADLPIKDLGDEAPEYDRPWTEPEKPAPLPPEDVPAPDDYKAAILKMIAAPDMCSKRWIWRQYDYLVQANTAQIPGGDAAVIRVHDNGKAIAVCADVTPRYVEADPYEGGKQAVAECWRNLTAVGAQPLAVTDNLNFGNPEKPEIMGQFVMAIKGIALACSKLEFPVVSGNVSLYNETHGQAILPTPTIGGVGVMPDWKQMMTIAFKKQGDVIILIGGHGRQLGQSIYLREVLGREDGPPPIVDLDLEKKRGDYVRKMIRNGLFTAVHDISDGGLALALADMAIASGMGAEISFLPPGPEYIPLFSEDQGRYVVTCAPEEAERILATADGAGVPAMRIGMVSGSSLKLEDVADIPVDELKAAYESWLPAYMSGEL